MRADLQRAHDASRLVGTLEDAMKWPALARCLEITARILKAEKGDALRPAFNGHKTKPARKICIPPTAPRGDFKRASAGDIEE